MNRLRLVEDLFEATAELDEHARSSVLRERAGGDPELVREVEALIAADRRSEPRLDGTAFDVFLELGDELPADALCGTLCGAYRIEEHVSSGGMAHVYRAMRVHEGTERRVALKVVRPGLDTDAFLERFRRERATLARLEHEHIVTFLDAGSLPDGRPFLVMEYVDGEPLTTWARRVPLRERLVQFVQVLEAVQYAHRNLIVHRDLKPGNVLVTARGIPKLLDFGVATILTEHAAYTTGDDEGGPSERGPLTLAYASPEALRGELATTASDVWSLGVMLREVVGEDRCREVGDLRAIVAHATADDHAARYRSADHMAEDLRRLLAFQPVSVRRSPLVHRIALFVRRNRWATAIAATIVLSLAVGWAGAALERRIAERDASRGWSAHAQARVVGRIFEEWLASTALSDPAIADLAAARLEAALADELGDWPESEALLRLTLAQLYLDRGELGRARTHAARSRELALEEHLGGDVLPRAEALLVRVEAK